MSLSVSTVDGDASVLVDNLSGLGWNEISDLLSLLQPLLHLNEQINAIYEQLEQLNLSQQTQTTRIMFGSRISTNIY